MDIDKLEAKIDRTAAGATEISMTLGGVQFQSMLELMEFAKLMAVSGSAVPHHLRGNPGTCLAICTKALRFGFDPFSLAEHSYSMKKSQKVKGADGRDVWEDVETIAYDSFVIRAIIAAHAPLTGRIEYEYRGDGDERICIASATPRGASKPLTHDSPTLGKLKEARGKNNDGKIKGSPLWETKPDQQLSYDTGRDFCRKHFPEVLLGWYDKDEMEENVRAAVATDITPAEGLKNRLKGASGAGFNHAGLEAAITHQPGQVMPETVKPTADKVEVLAPEPKKGTRKKPAASVENAEPPADQGEPALPVAAETAAEPSQTAIDETAKWLTAQIDIANNTTALEFLEELDPQVWKRLKDDGREKDLGPTWDLDGYEPNRARLRKESKTLPASTKEGGHVKDA